ncbi:MAG: GNAT family N-acetyltransferase [Verrucomicrobiota bacterium]
MLTITPTSSGSDAAQQLIRELDEDIAALYPGMPINGIDVAEFERAGGYFVVAQDAGEAVGCGAFRPLDERCAEIKRMFVRRSARRRGIARQILRHLEEEIRRRGFRSIVLETGCDNAEALALYEAEGYFPIPPFLGYVGSPISRCYVKKAPVASWEKDTGERSVNSQFVCCLACYWHCQLPLRGGGPSGGEA